MALRFLRSSETSTRKPVSTPGLRLLATENASQLAHDARNWLTTLQVYCDLLHDSGAIVSGYEPWMDELAGAIQRGRRLVDSLLESLEDTGEAVQERKERATERDLEKRNSFAIARTTDAAPLDLASALFRRLPLLQDLAGSKIPVEIDAPENAVHAQLPESAFERILYNLVANAIEAMPQGGKLRIALCSGHCCPSTGNEIPKKTVLLRVADTGIGIEPFRLLHIFDAGVSGKEARNGQPKRHGFGLAIVRELTERAGGTVRVRSQPGRGTRFELELPGV